MNAALEARPPSRERRTKSHSKVQRILVAVDLSGWSKATVIYAAGIADLFGAAVTLIHRNCRRRGQKTATDGWFRTIPGELSASPEAKVSVQAENENKTAKEKSNTCDNQ
jgi:nucleotide-binding universal stress UspA family protein